jgi:hypothetical protein
MGLTWPTWADVHDAPKCPILFLVRVALAHYFMFNFEKFC